MAAVLPNIKISSVSAMKLNAASPPKKVKACLLEKLKC
jgi:hypothetical protein